MHAVPVLPPIPRVAAAGRRLAACAVALAVGAVHPGAARAEDADVAAARARYLDADFEGARAAFDTVLRDPALDPPTALVAHRYLATLHLLLGDAEAAERHAQAAVAIDPAADPPEGAPPEAAALFDRAAEASSGPPSLTIETDGEPMPGETLRIEARLAPAPDALAAALHLECASDGDDVETRGRPPSVALDITVAGRVACEAEALSEGGARLFSSERAFGSAEAGDGPGDGGPGAWVWALAGAGVAVVAGVVALLVIGSSSGDQATLGSPEVTGW